MRSQSPKFQAAMKKLSENPEWQAANAAAIVRRTTDPNWQAAIAEANKKKAQDPEWRANQATGSKKRSESPEWQAQHKAQLAKQNHERWHVKRGIVNPECELCRTEVA